MTPAHADMTEVNAARTFTDVPSAPSQSEKAHVAPTEAQPAPRMSRRKWFKRLLGLGAVSVASGAYGTEVEPFWVEWHDVPMPLKNLPKSFEGFRITQLTDLHAGPNVPFSYLRRVVERVKHDKPNLVVVTGDLVHHTVDAVAPVCDLLAQLQHGGGIPVVASLGNHDYDVSSAYTGVPTRIADALEQRLNGDGIRCLR